MNYYHSNWRTAKPYHKCYLIDAKYYRSLMLQEHELIELWFKPEEEDWIDKAFKEYELLNNYKLDKSYHKEFRQAIEKHLPK